jgi:Cd2+/Zn2+-exporting ATPase
VTSKGCLVPDRIEAKVEELALHGAISVLVGRMRKIIGILALQDQPRPEVADTLRNLQKLGIRKSVLLTGDNENTARYVAGLVGIDDIRASLLPEEKVAQLEELRRRGYLVAMVGDGVNDAPSLAAADVGIAMGDTGTDIAADAAGVVLVGEKGFARLPTLVRVSRRTIKTIRTNILWFGLIVNLLAVVAAFVGVLSAIAAAILHQLTSFAVLISSLRLLRNPINDDLESQTDLKSSA